MTMTSRRHRLLMLATVCLATFVACSGAPRSSDEQSSAVASPPNADADTSQAPGADEPATADGRGPLTAFNLRANQVRTRHLFDGTVTAGKVGFKAVTVNVAGAATVGSSAADPDLVGGVLFSCDPSGNQDQHLDNAVLNGDGSITCTLGVAATAQNNFRCIALKANAKGVS